MRRCLARSVPLAESKQKRRIPEVRRSRVEQTLPPAAFDFAFDFDLASSTVEERRFSAE